MGTAEVAGRLSTLEREQMFPSESNKSSPPKCTRSRPKKLWNARETHVLERPALNGV